VPFRPQPISEPSIQITNPKVRMDLNFVIPTGAYPDFLPHGTT
jgi:hypothetical protein